VEVALAGLCSHFEGCQCCTLPGKFSRQFLWDWPVQTTFVCCSVWVLPTISFRGQWWTVDLSNT